MKKLILGILLILFSIGLKAQHTGTFRKVRTDSIAGLYDTLHFTDEEGSSVYFLTRNDSLFISDAGGEVAFAKLITTTNDTIRVNDSININNIWYSSFSSVAGSKNQIQINGDGIFDASSNLTWNDTTLVVNSSIGTSNMNIGDSAGYSSSSGSSYNTFIGRSAGKNTFDVDYMTCLGFWAGREASGSFWSTYIGYLAGSKQTSGNNCTYIGSRAGENATSSAGGTFIGGFSGNSVTDGLRNTLIGADAGRNITTGDDNVFVGYQSGYNNNKNDNVCIGYQSGYNALDRNVMIGYLAGFSENGSDKLYIENTNSTSPLIYGEFDNDLVRINGDLDVTGDFDFSGTINIAGLTDSTLHLESNDGNSDFQVEMKDNNSIVNVSSQGDITLQSNQTDPPWFNTSSIQIRPTYGAGDIQAIRLLTQGYDDVQNSRIECLDSIITLGHADNNTWSNPLKLSLSTYNDQTAKLSITDNNIYINSSLAVSDTSVYNISYVDVNAGAEYEHAQAAVHPATANSKVYCGINIPSMKFGNAVVIKQITVYYYTDVSGDDWDFELYSSDNDGTITSHIDIDDIGNGETGNSFINILSSDETLTDFSYTISFDVNNTNLDTDVLFYNIRIVYTNN